MLPLPAYGRRLWQQRLAKHHPPVVALIVGDDWRAPRWLPKIIPRLALKNAVWHTPSAPRFDWRVIVGCTVLAIDQRLPGERAEGPDAWDSWLWLLAAVREFARDVLLFTPAIEVVDPPCSFALEREIETYAWLNRSFDSGAGRWSWPPWWPYGARFVPEASAA